MVNDFIYQKNYILSQAQRLLGMQDKLPLSPSRGCFQYAYWRDRASDFPDSRFQEAGAALGLIAHPLFFDSSLGVKLDSSHKCNLQLEIIINDFVKIINTNL